MLSHYRTLAAKEVAFDSVVRSVDLRGQPLGALSLLGIYKSIRVVALDEFATFSADLSQIDTRPKIEPVVGGDNVWGVLSRYVARRGRAPPIGVLPGRSLFRNPFPGSAFLGGAPFLGGTPPGGLEGAFKGLTTLTANADGFSEALVVYVRDEAPGKAAQAAAKAHRSSVIP